MAKASKGDDVQTFLEQLAHTRKDEVELLRAIILGSDKSLTERVKWNAPSFCYKGEDRITFRLQPGNLVQLVIHRGAKVKSDKLAFQFEDPSGLVKWAATDRGIITFTDKVEIKQSEKALRNLVRAWLDATTDRASS